MAEATPKITVMPNGPYQVLGNVPLVRKTPVKSDKNEAIGWRTSETVQIAANTFRSVLDNAAEFPDLHKSVALVTPDETLKRHGQAIAAASLPALSQ